MRVVIAYGLNTLVNVGVGLVVALALGPDGFGRFALALALAALVQMLLFDWLRYAAQRFVTEAASDRVVATLTASFSALALLLCAKFALLVGLIQLLPAAWGQARMTLGLPMVGLIFALSLINGMFDVRAAVLRAQFHDVDYARLMGMKNIAAVVVGASAAFVFHSAEVSVACVALAMVVGLFATARGPTWQKPPMDWALVKTMLRYAGPLVLTNGLYLVLPLVTRALLAARFGYGESGQFSLAYDIASKLVMAVGTALDVVLFQLAVRAESQEGPAAAGAQLVRNAVWVLAVLTPACLGAWLILPSLETLLVPQAFRGPFGDYVTLLLPGLWAWGLATFGLAPVLQLAHRTAWLVGVAAAACALHGVVLLGLSASLPAHRVALVLSVCLGVGALSVFALAWFVGLRRAMKDQPRTGIIWKLVATNALLMMGVWPLRMLPPHIATLTVQVVVGLGISCLAWWGWDMLQTRQHMRALVVKRWR